MSKCKFYLIHSKKSEEMVDGLHKITLWCENKADAQGFLWIDAESNIQHIQLLFGEIVIEWVPEKESSAARTKTWKFRKESGITKAHGSCTLSRIQR